MGRGGKQGPSSAPEQLTRPSAGALGYLPSVARIGVLASGSGTILRAMLARDLPIAVVLVDRSCGATEIAEEAGVPVEIVERSDFSKEFDRLAYTERVVEALG